MKQYKADLLLVAAMVATLGACFANAEEAAALTRAQWLKKIGASVTQDSVMKETLAQVLPDERVEFTRLVLRAVRRLPVSPEQKAAAFVKTAVVCIANSKGELRYKVIAEVFACVPVEFLPVVTEELAKRFDQEFNKLSDEEYERIATAAIKVAVLRNAQTDEPSVRNTFVLLAFLRGAKNPKLLDVLLALLPDDRMRGLATAWIGPALKDHNYDGLLAAADVELTKLSSESILRLVGHATLDRLLAEMSSGQSLSLAGGAYVGIEPVIRSDIPVDHGINRLPRTYQNQTSSIIHR